MGEDKEIIVITGSSNKFGAEIYKLAKSMRESGKFVIDDSMFHLLPEEIGRCEFMKCILGCDRLLVFNKEGYIGFHTRLEITMAEVTGKVIEYLFPKEEE